MRILLATHFYPPGHLGGTEVLTSGLAQSLVQAGHEVQVICNEDWDRAPGFTIQESEDLIQGVRVRRLHFNWMKAPDVFRYLYNNPQVYRYFSKLLDEFQPDILHITSLYSLTASIIQAASEAGIPIVLTATDFWFVCAKNTLLRQDGSLCPGQDDPWDCTKCLMAGTKAFQGLRKILPESVAKPILSQAGRVPWVSNRPGFRGMLGNWRERFAFQNQMLQKVDRIVTASRFLRALYLRYHVTEEKISFSAYGLDTTWARGYTHKTKADRLRIGFIGQLIPLKGVDLLLRAAGELDRNLPVEFKIYGDLHKDPAYAATLTALAEGDPRISFLGTFDNSLMGEVMTGIDLLAVPSTWYDFPLVVPSALATHTPVIATDLPGMNEMILPEKNGLLFERCAWKALAGLIRRVVEDKELLPRLREGIEPVKTVAEMANEYQEIYQQLGRGGSVDPNRH